MARKKLVKRGKRVQCRHCKQAFKPVGMDLLQTCPFCDASTYARKATDAELTNLADALFSVMVRMTNASSSGNVTCCTCGKRDHWKNMDAGHFVPRGKWATRYVFDNVNPQCHRCNRKMDGMAWAHAAYIDETHHPGRAAQLVALSREAGRCGRSAAIERIAEFAKKVWKRHSESMATIVDRHRCACVFVMPDCPQIARFFDSTG